MNLKLIRMALYAVLGGFVVSLGLFYAYVKVSRDTPVARLLQPTNTIGGPFNLVDQTGKPVSDKDLLGRPTAMFFGYTYCPDVCPTTLAEAGEWLKALGPAGDRLQVVFVSVDPERDTPAKLADYLSVFDPRIRGLSGTPENTAAIIKAYRVFARKVPGEAGAPYLMDHTAAVYLMDGKGAFVGTINYQEETAKALAKLKQLVGQG